MYLAVGIGDTDIIQINQGNLTYARSGQRLSAPRANTANANYGNMQPGNVRGLLLAL